MRELNKPGNTMVIPETLVGVREALAAHIMSNREQFHAMDEKYHALQQETQKAFETPSNEKDSKMTETINVGGGENAALMAMLANRGGNDGMLGGGGILGGLLLGTLLRNGGLGGVNGEAGAALRSPPEQSQANMSLMAAIGAVDKSVALSTATIETSNAVQTGTLTTSVANGTAASMQAINSLKDVLNANTMALVTQIGGVDRSVMENRYELAKDIAADGEKTRALLVSQYAATLNRQLSEANAALVELRSQAALNDRARGIEVTTVNNINQAQQQQQLQTQFNGLASLLANLANDLQYVRVSNPAINVGSGMQFANPNNNNTNIR
jgi:hypothetical protein